MPNGLGLIIEIVYFILIVFLCLTIYIRTKKIYEFSKHQGIKYFRNAFLFFALIYFFRFVAINTPLLNPFLERGLVVSIESFSMFLVIYFSLLAIFSLTASFSWKDIKIISENSLHFSSLILALIIYIFKLPIVLLVFGIAIILFLALKAYFNFKHKHHKLFSNLFVAYALLFGFWLFDMVPFVQEFMKFELKTSGYIASILIFIYLNYKIKGVLESDKKKQN